MLLLGDRLPSDFIIQLMDFFSESIQIGDVKVGHRDPVFVIAEAGVAHFGSMATARQLVDMAVAANANAVKFQIFITDELVSPVSPEWQARLRSKELPFSAFVEIKAYCDSKGILFLATAHDEKSFEFLISLDVAAYKVGSGEVDNTAFLEKILLQNKPVVLSTGLHDKDALQGVIELAYQCGNSQLILLHCNTAYPTPVEQSHLKSIWWMRDHFKIPVGYSDHTIGTTVPLAAVALGACVIEKHICLDNSVSGSQDCQVALQREELINFVKGVRDTENSLGDYGKQIVESARSSVLWARKSLVVAADKAAGQVLEREDILIKRPGTGISPLYLNEVIGMRLRRAVTQDSLFAWEDFECQEYQEKSVS